MSSPDTPTHDRPVPVLLDTDIGTDVDDLLALIVLEQEPSLDLKVVTTVYGDVHLRAQMAKRVLRLLGRPDVQVHAGQPRPQSGREVWWAGHEGVGIEGLEDEEVEPVGGVEALTRAARAHAGELAVVAIGPLTNIAQALDDDPEFASNVDRLVIMGAEFARGIPEHNIRCDVTAANRGFACGISSVFVGLDVTTTVWFDETDLTEATRSGSELASLVDGQVREWWRFTGKDGNHPHDPLAVLSMIEPGLFMFEKASWAVVEDGEDLGAVRLHDEGSGVTYAREVNTDAVRREIVRRLADGMTR
jgi:purine nucleosidase